MNTNVILKCAYCYDNFNVVHKVTVDCPAVSSIIHSNLPKLLTDEQHGPKAYGKAFNILYQSHHKNSEPLIGRLETYPIELPQEFPFDTGWKKYIIPYPPILILTGKEIDGIYLFFPHIQTVIRTN